MTTEFDLILTSAKLPDASPPPAEVVDKSLFFKTAIQQWANVYLGPRLEDLDPSEGELWEAATPQQDGRYHFSIGAELPFVLPEIDGPEHVFDLGGDEYILSNRMVRAYYGPQFPDGDGFQYLLVHRSGLGMALSAHELGGCHPVPMRSFVSRSFSGEGDSASQVARTQLADWIEQFVRGVNEIVDAYRVADPANTRRIDRVRSANSLEHLWLVIESSELTTAHQLSVDLRQTAFLPHNSVDPEGKALIEGALNGTYTKDPYRLFMASAYNQLHYGNLQEAVISLAIAMENFLSMAVARHLKEQGVSSTTLAEIFDRVSYSQMLKLYTFSMVDHKKLKGFRDIVGRVDWARKQRNDVIHTGNTTQPLSRERVEEAINSGVELINFIAQEMASKQEAA